LEEEIGDENEVRGDIIRWDVIGPHLECEEKQSNTRKRTEKGREQRAVCLGDS